MLDDDELAELEPEASRDIEITSFVAADAITHQWYDRPYFLGPDGADENYFALAAALEEGRQGVARWVMRNKEYVGALRAERWHLMLMTLRHAGEVVPAVRWRRRPAVSWTSAR
jgi:DNA end-binding protein Ku